MPDVRPKKDDPTLYEYLCGGCGEVIPPKARFVKFEVGNCFGDVHDYVLVCGKCAHDSHFPRTTVV